MDISNLWFFRKEHYAKHPKYLSYNGPESNVMSKNRKEYLYKIRKSKGITFEKMYQSCDGLISFHNLYLVDVGKCDDQDIAQEVLGRFNALANQQMTLDDIYTDLQSD